MAVKITFSTKQTSLLERDYIDFAGISDCHFLDDTLAVSET